MDSNYDENDYMPAQTGEQRPLPEPENKPRIKIESNGGLPKQTVVNSNVKKALRRAVRPTRNTGDRRGQGKPKPGSITTKKLTILLNPDLLTRFKIHALKMNLTYSKLASEAFLAVLTDKSALSTTPQAKKAIIPSTAPISIEK